MNYKRVYDWAFPMHEVRVKSSELTAALSDGDYLLNNETVAAELGFGSDIVVIDQPGKVLFWDSVAQVAHDWTRDSSGGGEEEPV